MVSDKKSKCCINISKTCTRLHWEIDYHLRILYSVSSDHSSDNQCCHCDTQGCQQRLSVLSTDCQHDNFLVVIVV